MRTKIILFIISFITFNLTNAQNNIAVPKGAKEIIIKNELTKIENGEQLVNTLLENSYEIADYNKELGTVKTSLKTHKSASYYFYIRYSDNQIVLKGMFKPNYSISIGSVQTEPTFYDIENRGMKNSEMKETFNRMLEFSNKLKSENVDYK
ncbi:MAG: hypothetical protein O9340_15685 [Cyclobacteriaceae bacterium]|nr:hypothetical protein [Cyclobacteriaceae bacterium]